MDILHINIGGLIVLLLMAVAVAVIVVRFYSNRHEGVKQYLPVPIRSAVAVKPPLRVDLNPLHGISFEASLQPEVLSKAIQSNVTDALLKSYGVDTANTVLQITATRMGGLLVNFKDQHYELVRTTEGTYKAMTRDARGFHEIANVDRFHTWLNNFSHASAAVVAVAHLISNADMSKRLGQVQQNTNKLLEYRQIDTLVGIRTAYEALREEIGKVEPQRDAITRCRETFRENRHRLFAEAKNDVANLNPLLRTKQGRLRGVEQWSRTGQFNQRKRELAEMSAKLQNASYCFQMEDLAATYCGSENDQRLLHEEAAGEWSKLALEIAPLEDEIKEHDQCAKQLLEVASIMRGMYEGESRKHRRTRTRRDNQ